MSKMPEWLMQLISILLRFLLEQWDAIRVLMQGMDIAIAGREA